jgi:S-adenosylmethionine hydrolase
MTSPIVTFTSDFGNQDWFVGVVHGVLAAIAPQATVIDLNHTIPPGDVARGAFILEAAAGDFSPGTVHLAVVDPGVGTTRRALAVEARGCLYVGPDNGLLEWALCAPGAVVHALTEERWFRIPVSRTFHGRDVFAPVAAHLSRGVALAEFGPRVHDPLRLPLSHPHRDGAGLAGHVVFIDRFGNALTNLTESVLREAFGDVDERQLVVGVPGRVIRGLSRSYGEAPVGTLVAVLGSSGRIEIAQVGGDAAARQGLGPGDPVSIVVST